jgi:putative ABC transport system permease protein
VLPLEAAVTPGQTERRDGIDYHPAVVLGKPISHGFRDIDRLYVATPEVLDHHPLTGRTFRSTTDVVTGYRGPLGFANPRERGDPVVAHIAAPPYSSGPTSLLLPAALERHGWAAAPDSWLIEAPAPLTPDQIAAARSMAVRLGLTVETRDHQAGLSAVKTWATAVGIGVVLAILTMTVGLIRAEASTDLRTLAATGASGGVRRGIVAATAGGLALLGVVLGTAGAYLALVAGYLDDLGALADPPIANLALVALGVPILAIAAGWLLGGREPAALARPALD